MLASALRRGDDDARPRPLAGVVEQVAEHLVEVFALARGRRAPAATSTSIVEAALGVEPQQRARAGRRPTPRPTQRAPSARARRGRARVREVVVDLPAHPLDLLRDRRRELAPGPRPRRARPPARGRRAASSGRARGRRPWPARALDRRSRSVEQRVQVVDERLHFARDSRPRAARSRPSRTRASRARSCVERREPAPHLRQARRPCSTSATAAASMRSGAMQRRPRCG